MSSTTAAAHVVTSNRLWNAAAARGGELAELSVAPTENVTWEYVATRDIFATALYALGHRDSIPVADVGLDSLAWPLFERADFMELATARQAAAGRALDHLDTTDPVSCQWEWLNRYWNNDEDAPINQLWDGLPRMLARGLRWPAIDVCRRWVCSAVDRGLCAARGGFARRTAVQVVAGEFAGHHGHIESSAWILDPQRQIVAPGPPAGYMVNFGREYEHRTERILAEHIAISHPGRG